MSEHQIDFISLSQDAYSPDIKDINKWVLQALENPNKIYSISIVTSTPDEIQNINKRFRDQDKATNVLAFPLELNPKVEFEAIPIGDLVVCPQIIQSEAKEQGKSFHDHFAHILIHGTLHLLGYTHEDDDDAYIMESKEIQLLKKIGIENPYIKRKENT